MRNHLDDSDEQPDIGHHLLTDRFESARVLLYHCSHVTGRSSWPVINGAVAQLGERMTGSHEVRGSIPLGSTIPFQ